MEDCTACQLNNERFSKSIAENIFENDYWRVMHAFNTSLLGWLVIGALRHIETLADMKPEEALSLGELIRKTSKAIQTITGAEKAYSIMFSDKPDFSHVHFHIVPRHKDLPLEQRGSNIFQFLNVTDNLIVPLEQRNQFAAQIRVFLLEPSF